MSSKRAGGDPKVVDVRPPARAARLQARHWLVLLSFVIVVALPTLGTAYYLYVFAADQYASRVAFTVRQEEASSASDLLGGLTNLSNASSSDTDILYEFIQSQEMVRGVDRDLDLRAIYQKPHNDPLFTLVEGATIEDMVAYWQRVVRLYYDPGTGLIEVEVRAFEPRDAQRVATKLFELSSRMINELSAIAREDLTGYVRDELDQAVERLKDARRALTQFRNETQIVDVDADLKGQIGLLTSLQAQLADALIELDLLRETVQDGDPRVGQAQRRIEVIQRRIDEERNKIGGANPDGRAYADLVGDFESLQVDLRFAEESYLSALAAYDSTIAEARRQNRYLAAYVRPTLAEAPIYPRRTLLIGLAALALFGIWVISVLVYYSLRDRR
ncbi:capsule biosynthesis protein [Rhodobacteraceae bacterium CCMM004]|nr:capsule biosynthesis protein [Rhodobacteraceae bacterium CCMM004]